MLKQKFQNRNERRRRPVKKHRPVVRHCEIGWPAPFILHMSTGLLLGTCLMLDGHIRGVQKRKKRISNWEFCQARALSDVPTILISIYAKNPD